MKKKIIKRFKKPCIECGKKFSHKGKFTKYCKVCRTKQRKIVGKNNRKTKARSTFLKMFRKLPDKSTELVLNPYDNKPMSLRVIYFEIKNETELGKECLKMLGYEMEE